jgi:predicted Zn finger-like uncharacterized protein
MIVQCEKCQTKYNLADSSIKEGGSKVRCSRCKNIFVAYPPPQAGVEGGEAVPSAGEGPEKQEMAADTGLKDVQVDFEKIFEDSLEDADRTEAMPPVDHEAFEEEKPGTSKEIEEMDLGKEVSPSRDTKRELGGLGGGAHRVEAGSGQVRRKKSYLLHVFFVILFVILGAATAVVFWIPDLIPDSLQFLKPVTRHLPPDIGIHKLSLRAVTGAFVDSEKAGSLFVVRGMVKNNYSKSRSLILIKANIMDDKGQVIRQKLAYAGNTFQDEEVRVLPLDEMEQAMKNKNGKGESNVNLAPGGTIPFMVVFENLPENLTEFSVEAVSSSAGT